MLIQIRFGLLARTDKNVRVVDPEKFEDKELIASIEHYGVVENLVVFVILPPEFSGDVEMIEPELWPEIPGIRFAVMAGGRRYSALEFLLKAEGCVAGVKMTADFPVWCKVAREEDATAISLIENLHRADMHPADQFVAFVQLSKEGKSDAEIAKIFGKSKNEVRKLKRLGSVAPALITLFRKGKLDLDDMMAFAFTDDQERQMACYNEFKNRYINPHEVRRFLSGGAITTDDRKVKFIGLAAYKKAGGRVEEDLFGPKSYVLDPDILKGLAEKKLNSVREKCLADGWAWCEITDDSNGLNRNCTQLEGEFLNVPAELQQRIDDAQRELERLQKGRNRTDEDDEREGELDELLDNLSNEAAQYQTYSAGQKALAGCTVSIGFDGKADINYGLVRKADLKKIPKQQGQQGTGETVPGADGGITESAVLIADLGTYYLQAFQTALLDRDDLADDMLTYSMAHAVLDDSYRERLVEVRFNPPPLQAVGIEETLAAELLRKGREKLALGWLQEETPAEQFRAFVGLSKAEKRRIKTYCVAVSALSPMRSDEEDAGSVVLEMLGFDVSLYWQPTKEMYFDRITKNHLLSIGASVIDVQWADDHQKTQKGVLSDLLPTLDQMKNWMPPCMR